MLEDKIRIETVERTYNRMKTEETLRDLLEKHEKLRKERRYKILSVSDSIILSMLYPISEINIISRLKLPGDVYPVSVWYRPERKSFEFLLESESFEPVKPGEYVPEMDSEQVVVSRSQIVDLKLI